MPPLRPPPPFIALMPLRIPPNISFADLIPFLRWWVISPKPATIETVVTAPSFSLLAIPPALASTSSILTLPSDIACLCSSDRFANSPWFLTILPNWDTLTPIVSAKAFLCIVLSLLNSASLPTFLSISSVAPTKSPSKANCLALSKLISLPSNTDASICLSILPSKSSKLSAAPTIVPNSTPNFLAATAAIAMFFPPSLLNVAVASALLAISFITSPGATPAAVAKLPANFKVLLAVSIVCPGNLVNCAVNCPASILLIPYVFASDAASNLASLVTLWMLPISERIPLMTSIESLALTPVNENESAIANPVS